jgi:ribonuclease P protein component
MLPFRYRFHGHGGLRFVYKNGRAVRSHLLTLKYSPNPRRHDSRFAVVVSKKVHKGAVGRNRIRRRMYEALRQELPRLKTPIDLALIISSSELMTIPPEELHQTLQDLLTQADLYK